MSSTPSPTPSPTPSTVSPVPSEASSYLTAPSTPTPSEKVPSAVFTVLANLEVFQERCINSISSPPHRSAPGFQEALEKIAIRRRISGEITGILASTVTEDDVEYLETKMAEWQEVLARN